MYTVIIAEQEHIDNIREYRLFLEPFMKKTQFAFCPWKPEEADSLKKSVPDLEREVAQREEWRAVILCDERGLKKKNPFNIVEYHAPEWDEDGGERMEDFYARRLSARKASYELAAKEPLVRLVTRLCEDPVVRKRGDGDEDAAVSEMRREAEAEVRRKNEKFDVGAMDSGSAEPDERDIIPGSFSYRDKMEYLEFREYRECALYKQQIRDEIRGDEPLSYTAPREVLCIAKRHHDDMDYALRCVWTDHDEREYSRFYDWNLYYDRMRYLVFDMDDKKKQNYRSDYIRFLLGVILLAGNRAPGGSLQPNRVYELRCDVNEEKMAQLLGRYNAKLAATKAELQVQISDIRSTQVKRLTDDEAEQIFCANISIPISLRDRFDPETLYCNEKFGLSYDCPVDDEEIVWMGSYLKNRKAMKKLVKQPARAIKQATDTFRRMNVLSEDRAAVLNEFQVDDVKEHIGVEEREMVETYTENIYDVQRYYKRMEDKQRSVHDVLERRMRKKVTVFWGVLCLALVFVGMLPVFLMNRTGEGWDLPLPPTLILLIAALGTLAVAGMICLFVLRWQLVSRVKDYNTTMWSILGQIENDVKQHSVYLGHACNMMRGISVISYFEKHKDGDAHQIRILQKHVADMDEQQAVIYDLFGRFLNRDEDDLPVCKETPYDFNFSLAKDYRYPLPKAPEMQTRIEFLERGNYVDIPYGIIKSLELRREELYE
ncbi:MAG: hypothetical protein LUC83_02330 [Clostridiales bacterium]|nr:hypothetical protein [Clostridiales bacterium]